MDGVTGDNFTIDSEARGAKRPRSYSYLQGEEESESDEGQGPELDLAGYFDHFGVDLASRITICRGYASYVASTVKARRKLEE